MKSVHLIDHTERIFRVLEDVSETGSETQIAGMGFFNCTRQSHLGTLASSLKLHVDPEHLRSGLVREVLAGRLSPLGQEVIMYGCADMEPLSAWLLTGLQLPGLLDGQEIAKRPWLAEVCAAQNLKESVAVLFRYITGIAAESGIFNLVFPIESPVLVQFLCSLFGRAAFGLAGSRALGERNGGIPSPLPQQMSAVEFEICYHKIAEAVILWSSEGTSNCRLFIHCQSNKHLKGLLSACRLSRSLAPRSQIWFGV